MPIKGKNVFNISPNENIKYSEGTLFAFYNKEYLVKSPKDFNFKKIVPWEIFNVEKPIYSEKDLKQYKDGAVWIYLNGDWKFLNVWKSPLTTNVPKEGIGYWAIGEEFIIS